MRGGLTPFADPCLDDGQAHMDAIIPVRVCALRTLRRRWLLPSDPVYTAAWGAGGDTVAVVVLPGFAVVVACCHCDGRVVLVTPMLSPLFCKVLSELQSWFAVSCHISRPLHQLHLYHAKGRPVRASLTRPWCVCEHLGVCALARDMVCGVLRFQH